MVREFKKDTRIRTLAGNLTVNLPSRAWFREIRALFDFVQSHIRYTQDITSVETLQTPVATLQFGYGDCDDMCTLLCALLESIGHHTRFVACSFENANDFEHVFVQTYLLEMRKWVSLDPTENEPMGWKPPGIINVMVRDN